MALLDDALREKIKQALGVMQRELTIRLQTVPGNAASDAMLEMCVELVSLSGRKISLEVPPADTSPDLESCVAGLEVDGVFTGMRYLGFPGGHEFGTFLTEVVSLSVAAPFALKPETVAYLEQIEDPLHFEVFTTPT